MWNRDANVTICDRRQALKDCSVVPLPTTEGKIVDVVPGVFVANAKASWMVATEHSWMLCAAVGRRSMTQCEPLIVPRLYGSKLSIAPSPKMGSPAIHISFPVGRGNTARWKSLTTNLTSVFASQYGTANRSLQRWVAHNKSLPGRMGETKGYGDDEDTEAIPMEPIEVIGTAIPQTGEDGNTGGGFIELPWVNEVPIPPHESPLFDMACVARARAKFATTLNYCRALPWPPAGIACRLGAAIVLESDIGACKK
jgi:hypothetical protein